MLKHLHTVVVAVAAVAFAAFAASQWHHELVGPAQPPPPDFIVEIEPPADQSQSFTVVGAYALVDAMVPGAEILDVLVDGLELTVVYMRGEAGPFAITSRLARMDLHDPTGSGNIIVDGHYLLTTDNAEAIAMGAGSLVAVVRMEAQTRSTVVTAAATILGNSLILDSGRWPEGAIALPRPRKP